MPNAPAAPSIPISYVLHVSLLSFMVEAAGICEEVIRVKPGFVRHSRKSSAGIRNTWQMRPATRKMQRNTPDIGCDVKQNTQIILNLQK
jgi:hypothetical protein